MNTFSFVSPLELADHLVELSLHLLLKFRFHLVNLCELGKGRGRMSSSC